MSEVNSWYALPYRVTGGLASSAQRAHKRPVCSFEGREPWASRVPLDVFPDTSIGYSEPPQGRIRGKHAKRSVAMSIQTKIAGYSRNVGRSLIQGVAVATMLVAYGVSSIGSYGMTALGLGGVTALSLAGTAQPAQAQRRRRRGGGGIVLDLGDFGIGFGGDRRRRRRGDDRRRRRRR